MGSKSDFLENELLDHVLRNAAYTAPSSIWIALYTVTPSDAGGGTEVTGNGYARLEVGGATGRSFVVAASGATDNTELWQFAQASGGNWGTIVAFGLFDASTAGNLLYWGAVSPSVAVNDGDTAQFATGALDITED